MNSIGSKYNPEQFIKEVEARPALWDSKSKDYADRYTRTKCWMEIAEIFFDKPNGDDLDKFDYAKLLQRKWKNLRDNYIRQLHRIQEGLSTSGNYKYFNYLLFLGRDANRPIPEIPPPSKKINIQFKTKKTSNRQEPLVEVKNTTETEFIDIGSRIKEEPLFDDIDEEVSDSNSCNKSRDKRDSPSLESDSDRWFLLSLIEPLKEVPENLRFTIKMEIMQVIENARLNSADTAIIE